MWSFALYYMINLPNTFDQWMRNKWLHANVLWKNDNNHVINKSHHPPIWWNYDIQFSTLSLFKYRECGGDNPTHEGKQGRKSRLASGEYSNASSIRWYDVFPWSCILQSSSNRWIFSVREHCILEEGNYGGLCI